MAFFYRLQGSGTTEAMRIDSAGNVGIGTSSPGDRLDVRKTTTTGLGMPFSVSISAPNNEAVAAGSGGGIAFGGAFNGSSATTYAGISGEKANGTSGNTEGVLRFGVRRAVSGTNMEAMRITSAGQLLLGTTTNSSGASIATTSVTPFTSFTPVLLTRSSGSVASLVSAANSTAARTHCVFETSVAVVGSITTSGSATAYNTSSDYRLKEDWQPMKGAITRLNHLKPVNFAWKVNGSRVDGFLAHEAQEVVPESVTGTKDAVDKDGKPEYQGIDQSKLVPLLTAALQEAVAEINSLKARLDAANL
jgi:hypothetical protein